MERIAVIVPTIRPERIQEFKKDWQELFNKHNVELVIVWDGDIPVVEYQSKKHDLYEVMGDNFDVIYNKSDCVRNLGFYFAYKNINPDYYITLDDDVSPFGDTIQDHISVLKRRMPITKWINTLKEIYPRGYPYGIRNEAPVMVSHGLWNTVLDLDAPTQLVVGADFKSDYNKLSVPKGCYIPFCGMNVAFRKEALPYMYYAPMGHLVELDRFADIFLGITLKDKLDEKNWALVTGYAEVIHKRASNVFTNLIKEAKGLVMNENFGEDSYFKLYKTERNKWYRLTKNVSNL